MREFNPQILRGFGLKAKNIKYEFGSYICNTNDGLKIIKSINLSKDSILFIHSAKEHLYKNGFRNIDRYSISKNNVPYYEFNKNLYVVKKYLNGEECNLLDLSNILYSVKTLAKMHNASVGLVPMEGSKVSFKYSNLKNEYVKHYRELTNIYKKIKRYSKWNDFDIVFIKNYKHYFSNAKEAKELLIESNFDKLVKEANQNRVFCHNKFTNHNVQISADDIMIINFDDCCYKLPICDLVRFMEKALRKSDWDIKVGVGIIEMYDKYRNLSKDELNVIYYMLLFPEKFWLLCNQHYNTRRNWMPKIYQVKMQKIIEQQNIKQKFLDKFRGELNI